MKDKNDYSRMTPDRLLEEFEAAILCSNIENQEEIKKPFSEKFFEKYKEFILNHDKKQREEMRRHVLDLYKKLKS